MQYCGHPSSKADGLTVGGICLFGDAVLASTELDRMAGLRMGMYRVKRSDATHMQSNPLEWVKSSTVVAAAA